MKKPILILALSASFIAGTMVAGNIVFADDTDGQNSLLDQILSAIQGQEPVCPAENVQHWTTYSWGSSVEFEHQSLPSVSDGTLEVQVPSDQSYTGPEVVANTLNELGYSKSGSTILPQDLSNAFIATASGVICAEN